MKLVVAFLTVFAVNAHATPGLRSLNWFWLPGPPVVEKMSPDEIVIGGTFEDLAIERVALRCPAKIRCRGACSTENSATAESAPCRMDVTACLPQTLRNDLGALYAQPGPNCFSTALRSSGVTRGLAGVDAPEIKAFAWAFCAPVETPRKFDIGVYHAPGVDAFAETTLWVHAFTFLSPSFVLEKQGVDYWGPTPVVLRGFSVVDYRVRISPECRRFASDPLVCANQLTFLRCRSPELPDDLTEAFKKMDLVAEKLLELKHVSPADFEVWDEAFTSLEDVSSQVSLDTATKNYVREKLASLRKQRQFFR